MVIGADSESFEDLLTALEEALALEGVSATVSTDVKAITASADGGVLMDVVLMLPAGYLAWFGQLLAKRTDSAVRRLVERIREKHTGALVIGDGAVRVVMEPGLPDEAVHQLSEPLPDAPSGELRFNRALGRWVDANEMNEDGD